MTPPTILRALGTCRLSCGEPVAIEKDQLQVIDTLKPQPVLLLWV